MRKPSDVAPIEMYIYYVYIAFHYKEWAGNNSWRKVEKIVRVSRHDHT